MILEGFMKLSFNLILTQYVTMKVTLKITIYVEYITGHIIIIIWTGHRTLIQNIFDPDI